MKAWTVQEAEAHFNELLETCTREGPQLVTRHGAGAAVLVAISEWRRLGSPGKPTLKHCC
jgi:antitoxin Phd